MLLLMANQIVKRPREILHNVLVKVDSFIFPVDFVIKSILKCPLILGGHSLGKSLSRHGKGADEISVEQ